MGHKLLLADDSITIHKIVRIIFPGDSYELTVVDNGNDALCRAREILPDVMLIDAVMPGRDGYEVCREARKDPLLSGVPILLLTGVFDPFDETVARESGADDFIAKPFESQVLIDKVAELVSLGASRRSAVPPPVDTRPSGIPETGSPAPAEWAAAEVLPPDAIPEAEAGTTGSPAITSSAATAEEPLVIEEVTALVDPWGMGGGEEEPSAIPFGAVASPQEGESLDTLEELVPLPVEEEIQPSPVGEATAGGAVCQGPICDSRNLQGILEGGLLLAEEGGTTVPGREAAGAAPQSVVSPPMSAASREDHPASSDGVATVDLSEEHLVAALSKVSRDVIERIVWEVVPDLAESLIREEIRKIRGGV